VAPEDIKFDFKFLLPEQAHYPYIKFKDLVFTDSKGREQKQKLIKTHNLTLTEKEEIRIEDNLETIKHVFATKEALLYQLVDSIDRPDTYNQDDIVEIFIRANSGGTTLSKSDLLFSLLTANWDGADENMILLLENLNQTGYKFSRDLILKTCLVLLNSGAKYQVEKFRKPELRDKIIEDWKEIEAAILDVKDFIYGNTFLHTDKTIPSYLSLIPIVYMRFHFKDSWKNYEKDYQTYLLRTSLTGAFSGQPDNLIDKLVKDIKENNTFKVADIFGVIREENRSLELTKDSLLSIHYSSKEIHLLFNLWYGFNYQPSFKENMPQADHIFPTAELKKIKIKNPDSGKMNIMKYGWQHRDQIANMMLLTAVENGAGGKSDTVPEIWFSDKSDDYLEKHLIPRDKVLWKMENFEEFIEARKKLLVSKFEFLLNLVKDQEE